MKGKETKMKRKNNETYEDYQKRMNERADILFPSMAKFRKAESAIDSNPDNVRTS